MENMYRLFAVTTIQRAKFFSENNFEYFESLKFCDINFKMQF